MAKITYTDKVAVNQNASIPDINKVNASDMNEIKRVVNENANINEYLTTEQVIGKWINGKPLYRKIIDLGTLPNKNTLLVPAGLSNILPVKIYGSVLKNNVEMFPLPFVWGSTETVDNYCGLFYDISNNQVYFRTNRDMSNYTGYAILEYTKTTD